MLVYLLIPVALAVVFFAMSFFQKETTVVNTSETTKEKPSKKPTKKPTSRTSTKNAPLKKVEKKDEKKDEKKEEVKKEEVVAADDKKKKKKSDWVTREAKPQRKKEEKKPEDEAAVSEEKKDEKKKGDKKGGDRKKGDKKGGKKGEKKEEAKEGEEKKEKSIYKVFKPHGAEADKVVEPAKTEEPKVEEKKEEVEATKEGEEKKQKKEKKPRDETKPLKPRVKMNYNPYKSSEDFWDTNLANTYVEPAPVQKVASPSSEEKVEKTEKKKPEKSTGGRKEKSEKGQPSEPKPNVQIKVGRGGITGRTDPWAKTDSQASTQVEGGENFPSLGQQNTQQATANKPKKDKKKTNGDNGKALNTSVDESSTQKKSDSHKREAKDTLFEYEVEAPSDKKIKLGDEVAKTSEKQDTFVLPTSE